MKKIQYLGIACMALLGVAQTSCKDADREPIENRVYIGEAANGHTVELTLQANATTYTPITIRLAKAFDSEVTATLTVDKQLLDEYNTLTEGAYQLVPDSLISLEKTVTIKAGEVTATPLNLGIKDFNTMGGQFALPLRISSASGVDIAGASSQLIVKLIKPLIQAVPKFGYENSMQADPQTNWGLDLPNYSLEWWSRVSKYRGSKAYSVNNQAIFNSGGGNTELYIRFGDLIYAQGGSYQNNFLQIKTMGSQFDTGDPTKGFGLEGDTWYHFAITYDASTGTSTLYKNGEAIQKLTTAEGRSMTIDKLQMISSGATYFHDYCELAQVRMWKTTRSANQIKKFMYSEVEYNHPDLILYLPMNEGSGDTLHDVTGNGHDVKIGNKGSMTQAHVWTTYTFSK